MSPESVQDLIFSCLRQIAPEVALEGIDRKRPFRSQVDLDSMDHLNFLVRLYRATGVSIPVTEYSKLVTLDQLSSYLTEHLAKLPIQSQTSSFK